MGLMFDEVKMFKADFHTVAICGLEQVGMVGQLILSIIPCPPYSYRRCCLGKYRSPDDY